MSVTRLQSHWGFTRMPFGRSLAPSMLHRHDGHAEAVARIGWCIEQHALGVITGEVGAGKTVAVRAATAGLDGSRHVVTYLPNPSVGVRGMLHHVVSTLGQTPSFYTATLVPQAAAALAAEHAERGRTPVVIFDEAHLLDNTQLEAVRMLTNHDMDSGAPFAALLVGQPTLLHRLRLGVLAALGPVRSQRTGPFPTVLVRINNDGIIGKISGGQQACRRATPASRHSPMRRTNRFSGAVTPCLAGAVAGPNSSQPVTLSTEAAK